MHVVAEVIGVGVVVGVGYMGSMVVGWCGGDNGALMIVVCWRQSNYGGCSGDIRWLS